MAKLMVLPRAPRKSRVPNGTQETAFVSAIIVQAIKEMRSELMSRQYSLNGHRPRTNEYRIRATTWLGSKDAEKWFDLSGVDQRFALDNMNWAGYARILLDAKPTGPIDTMTEEESELLRSGIDALGIEPRHNGD